MLKINTEQWPLVIFEFSGEASVTEHQQMLDEWAQLFARQQPFVALRVFHDDISLDYPAEVGQLTLRWLDDGAREAIKTWVSAMLHVTPEASYARMKHKSVERVFGVPGGVFRRIEDANQWLRDNIELQIEL